MKGKLILLVLISLSLAILGSTAALADRQTSDSNCMPYKWGLKKKAPIVTPAPAPSTTPTPTSVPTPVPSPDPTPVQTPMPSPTPQVPDTWWKPTSEAPIHWQWQLSQPFNIATDLIPGVTVYDIDGFENDANVVADLHARGCKVIAYLGFGNWESWRPDASQFPESVKGKNISGWAGEKWLDIRSDAVRAIMAARLDMVKAKGFDAVEPDCIDGYSNDTGFPLTAQDQIDYNRWIAEQCHQRGLSVGLKNDIEQAAELEPYFDWALNEECYQYRECDALATFINANKAVFQVEYKGSGSQCSTMNSMHINSMLRDLELVSPGTPGYVRVPCIPDTRNTWQ